MQEKPYNKQASPGGKPFLSILIHAASAILDFIYPSVCLLCAQRTEGGTQVCPACWDDLTAGMFIRRQHHRKDFAHLCGPPAFDEAMICMPYHEDIETLIHFLKYSRGKRLGLRLGAAMGQIFKRVAPGSDALLVPVPLHRARQRERGFNQSEILCRGMAECVRMSMLQGVLIRTKNTRTQTKLSAESRLANVRDAFMVKYPEKIHGKTIVLVDDVITTGGTVHQCAGVLRQAGATKIIALALARPQPDQAYERPYFP